jgi:hypothetical protein
MGSTFMERAILKSNISMVQLALEMGCDANLPDDTGATPLRKALVQLYFDFTRMIYLATGGQLGGEPSDQGAGGEPDDELALEMCRRLERVWLESRYERIVDLLMGAGAQELGVDESTGDYLALLIEAAGLFLQMLCLCGDSSDEDAEELFTETYRHFKFRQCLEHQVSCSPTYVATRPDGSDQTVLFPDKDGGYCKVAVTPRRVICTWKTP